MAKMTKEKLAAMGRRITSEAKRIRAGHPSMKWTTAMKEAGKKFRKKK
jgi:hypothetical protein